MGACYDVELKLNVKDEDLLKKLMNKYIDENNGFVVFNLEERDRNNLVDLVKIFITDRCFSVNGDVYESSFEASYGWESVMTESFEEYAEALEDGSYIIIWPDNDYDKIIVKNGKAKWIH